MSARFTRTQQFVFAKKGICIHCGKEPATDGGKWCFKCKLYAADQNRKRYYERKESHRCVRCGEPLPDEYTGTLCQRHADRARERQRTLNREWREHIKATGNGRCSRCGAYVEDKGRKWCRACRAQQREWYRQRYPRLKEAHRCVMCGAQLPEDETHINCAKCRERHRKWRTKW